MPEVPKALPHLIATARIMARRHRKAAEEAVHHRLPLQPNFNFKLLIQISISIPKLSGLLTLGFGRNQLVFCIHFMHSTYQYTRPRHDDDADECKLVTYD